MPTLFDMMVGSLHTEEKRDVTISVMRWTMEKLKQLGTSGNNNDDVMYMLIDFWEKHHRDRNE